VGMRNVCRNINRKYESLIGKSKDRKVIRRPKAFILQEWYANGVCRYSAYTKPGLEMGCTTITFCQENLSPLDLKI
jgi:hypothetical protein